MPKQSAFSEVNDLNLRPFSI